MTDRHPDNAHDLNRKLDRAVPPHAAPVGGPDADPLVRAAQRVAQGPDAGLSHAALDRIEARLRAQMDAVPPRPVVPAPQLRRRWTGLVLRYATILLLSVILLLVLVVQTASASLPGDRLYPVKRAVEDVRLALVPAGDEAALRVTLAARRVDEFEALLERGRVDPAVLDEANAGLTRALNLLADGQGNWADVELQMRGLAVRQAFLLDQATRRADEGEAARLAIVSANAVAVQQRIDTLAPPPPPVHPTAEPDARPTRRPTHTATATPRPSATASMTPSATPTATLTPTPTATSTVTPTRVRTGTPGMGGMGESSGSGMTRTPGPINPDQGGSSSPDNTGSAGGTGGTGKPSGKGN